MSSKTFSPEFREFIERAGELTRNGDPLLPGDLHINYDFFAQEGLKDEDFEIGRKKILTIEHNGFTIDTEVTTFNESIGLLLPELVDHARLAHASFSLWYDFQDDSRVMRTNGFYVDYGALANGTHYSQGELLSHEGLHRRYPTNQPIHAAAHAAGRSFLDLLNFNDDNGNLLKRTRLGNDYREIMADNQPELLLSLNAMLGRLG